MATGELLLAAIRADPGDDVARLAYADWLEEQGDTARAEFVRAQLELARPGVWDERRRRLRARELALLRQHRGRWEQELPDWARDGCEFSRGFVALVECSIRDFATDGPQLMERTPLEGIRVRGGRDGVIHNREIEWLAGTPHLRRLTALYLERGYGGNNGIVPLVRSPFVDGLTSLGLVGLHLNDVAALVLAECPQLAALRLLDLGHNAIGDAGAWALLRSEHLARLTRLYLDYNAVSAEADDAVRQRFGGGR